jgi:ribose transport system substrate-binding protein
MKRTLALVLALLMVLSLAACASTGTSSTTAGTTTAGTTTAGTTTAATTTAANFDPADYPVAIAIGVKNHPVHRIVELGFLKAAKELGYTAEVIGTEGTDWNEVYAACDAAAATGTKGIMLWAGDETAYPTLKKMKAADVAVGIAHFKFEPWPEGLTFGLACDAAAYGKACADFIAERVKGKKGSIAVTQNTKNNTENAAAEAFIARMAELNLPDVKVLPVELEGSDLNAATNINAAIIQKNPDIIAAFGTTGNSPVTWSDAASKAGKKPGEIVIVGMDYTEANLAKIESGECAAIIAQPLYQEAYKTMELLDQYFRTGSVPQWTPLEAPLVYKGGTGASDPATYKGILEEVKTWFK